MTKKEKYLLTLGEMVRQMIAQLYVESEYLTSDAYVVERVSFLDASVSVILCTNELVPKFKKAVKASVTPRSQGKLT